MAKKKTTYFQAICYTTEHCDGDLIAPACWEPTTELTKAADQIMQEIEESFSGKIRNAKQPGPESITIEYRNNTNDNIDWSEPKEIKNWKRAHAFLDKIKSGLADGSICTVMVTVPEYVNAFMVQIGKRSDVFHINQFSL
jgi:hypothetical protein